MPFVITLAMRCSGGVLIRACFGEAPVIDPYAGSEVRTQAEATAAHPTTGCIE